MNHYIVTVAYRSENTEVEHSVIAEDTHGALTSVLAMVRAAGASNNVKGLTVRDITGDEALENLRRLLTESDD